MAADIKKIIDNLRTFYNVHNQTIIWIGAGGGQFIEYGHTAQHVVAVDNDETALTMLQESLEKAHLSGGSELVKSDFALVRNKGDIVFFEFCLHEMPEPEVAIRCAFTLAPRVLVADHFPGSEWASVVDETEKVAGSWEALKRFQLQRFQRYDAVQFFHNFDELYQKVKSQGENSIKRIEPYRGKRDFTIPMSYGFALL